jgi:hypothetical protein
MRPWVFVFCAFFASSVPRLAIGQDKEESQRLFDAGMQAYDRGDFAEAVDHYDRSYRLAPRPRTLLRIAQSAEGAGQTERAADTYKAYLVIYPDAANRPSLEARIARLTRGPAPSGPRSAARPPTRSAPRPSSARPDLAAGDGAPTRSFVPSRPLGSGRWTTEDEDWYRFNRGFRVAGRVMTAVGGLLLIIGLATGLSTDNEAGQAFYNDGPINTLFAGTGIYALGSVVWAASTLRGTNEMRRRGVRISKVSAVMSVVGVFCPPILWVAGPMAGANMRRTHDDLGLRSSRSAADWLPSLRFRTSF